MDKKQFDTLKKIVDAVDSENLPDNVVIDLNTYYGRVRLVFEVEEDTEVTEEE